MPFNILIIFRTRSENKKERTISSAWDSCRRCTEKVAFELGFGEQRRKHSSPVRGVAKVFRDGYKKPSSKAGAGLGVDARGGVYFVRFKRELSYFPLVL